MAEEKIKKTKKAAPKGEVKEVEKEAQPKVRKELKPKVPSSLEKKYNDECVPALMEQFGFKNKMQVPRLEKIVLNTSMKEALQDVKILDTAVNEMGAIAGQKPVITRAKKSIANFKLRKGQPVGARVTLRKNRMYEFMNRLVNVALPRMRDFKGVSPKSFDGLGNYTLGITEQIIFPEINFDKVTKVNGMNITFVTDARNNEEAKALLSLMGMPFRTA